jgi:Rrf2 family transcriptional regulator, cysteine metabolism repressor
MNLAVKTEYALRAIFDLASQNSAAPVKIADIAQRQQIPQKFLELILASLKQGGLVESRRGAEGGYRLARPAEQITIGQVLRFVEQRKKRRPAPDAFSDLWSRVDEAMNTILDNTTFAELVRRWNEAQGRYIPNWQI